MVGDPRFISQELIKILSKQSNFSYGRIVSVLSNGLLSVQMRDGRVVSAFAGNSPRNGDCSVFFANGDYYAFSVNAPSLLSQQVVVSRKSRFIAPLPVDQFVFSAQLLFWVWDDDTFKYYVGGDRVTPTFLYEEDSETKNPATSNLDFGRGVDYTEFELSSLSNLGEGKFAAIISRTYGETSFNRYPVPRINDYELDGNGIPQLLSPYDGTVVIDGVTYNRVIRRTNYYKQGYSLNVERNNKENPFLNFTDYLLSFNYQSPVTKAWRFQGGGYSFGRPLLNDRIWTSDTTFHEIPPGSDNGVNYLHKISYLEPDKVSGTTQEVIVDLAVEKDRYSYALPVSLPGGNLPLNNPTVSFEYTGSSYIYEGEHYLNIGESSYITEYINSTYPGGTLIREIRFYRDRTFVTNLNTDPYFGVSHATSENGGRDSEYTNAIQVNRYTIGQTFTLISTNRTAPETFTFVQQFVGREFEAYSIDRTPDRRDFVDIWRADVTLESVQQGNFNNDGIRRAVLFNCRLISEPKKIPYSSRVAGLYGGYFNAADGVICLKTNSYYDFLASTTGIPGWSSSGVRITNERDSHYNDTAEFFPLDPNNKDYFYNIALNGNAISPTYQQDDLYGIGTLHPIGSFTPEEHISEFRYLDNNLCTLVGNRLYRYMIFYEEATGERDAITFAIQNDPNGSLPTPINSSGTDPKAKLYLEEWVIQSNGDVSRNFEVITSEEPIYGLNIGGVANWFFSDLFDISVSREKKQE